MSARKFPTLVKPYPSNLEVRRAEFRHKDPRDENPGSRQGWKIPDCGNCDGSRICFSGSDAALTRRDVKNEDRPGYVYEKKDDDDKMSGEKTGFCTKVHPFHNNRQQSRRLFARNEETSNSSGRNGAFGACSDYRFIDPSANRWVGFSG
jgi:hypothetical protein